MKGNMLSLFDLVKQRQIHPLRARHRLIVEEMLDHTGRRLPAHVLDLPGLRAALIVAKAL